MSVPAWQVSMWKPVRLTPRQWSRTAPVLRGLSVSINVDTVAGGLRYGQTLWGAERDGEMVGIAWDWREVRRDVIAMSDPMTVLSNLQLADEAGIVLSDSKRVIALNTAIFRLGWQERLRTDHAAEHLRLAA